jgi:hypothetical protein
VRIQGHLHCTVVVVFFSRLLSLFLVGSLCVISLDNFVKLTI